MLLLSISVSLVSIPYKFVNIEPVPKVSTQNLLKSNFILSTKITTFVIQGVIHIRQQATLCLRQSQKA